jgi:hypothetical protein
MVPTQVTLACMILHIVWISYGFNSSDFGWIYERVVFQNTSVIAFAST